MLTPTKPKKRDLKGIPCPFCGGKGNVQVGVEEATAWCGECGERLTRDDFRDLMSRIHRFIDWLDWLSEGGIKV